MTGLGMPDAFERLENSRWSSSSSTRRSGPWLEWSGHRAAAATDTVGDLESLQLSDASANPEAQAIAREGLRSLCQVLAELPTQQRRVFTLRKIYNLSHAEIADELGITISTAQKHLTKALAHVSAQMRDIED